MTDGQPSSAKPSGGMDWIEARYLLRGFSRVATLDAWPDSFTPEELAALQYPWEGTAAEKQKASRLQSAFSELLRKAMDSGTIPTTSVNVDEPIMEEKTVVTSTTAQGRRSTSWGGYAPRHTLVRQWVQTGTQPMAIEAFTASSFAGWAKGKVEPLSKQVASWLSVWNQCRRKSEGESMQKRREAVLQEWLDGHGKAYLERGKLTLAGAAAWEKLAAINGELFRAAAPATIEDFFKNQKLIERKPGRKTKHP